MSAKSSKGVKICMTGPAANETSYTAGTITDITAGKPTIITSANTAKAGDLVTVEGTGSSTLDGKTFVAGANTSATEIELIGADTTGETVPATVAGTTKVFSNVTCLCLNALAVNSDTPGTVSVGTYCDPTASIPSVVVQAGTLTFGGYVDITAEDYPALLDAAEDGLTRWIRIELPDNGHIIAPIIVSQMTWDLPLDGAIGFNGTATLGSKPKHLF
jgi:predicted secreted protein